MCFREIEKLKGSKSNNSISLYNSFDSSFILIFFMFIYYKSYLYKFSLLLFFIIIDAI